MSAGIGAAVRAGARRTASRGGVAFVLAFVVVGVVAMVGTQTLLLNVFEPVLETLRTQPAAKTGFTPSEVRQFATILDASTPFALSAPAWAAGALVVLAGLVREALRIVAIRVFAADGGPEQGRVRPLALPTLNGFVGGFAVWFLVGLGGVLGILAIVVGGVAAALFLATSFLFVRQVIALEGRNFVDALNESWRIASGHRLSLLGLGTVVVVTTVVAVTAFRIAGGVLVSPSVAWVAWLVCRGVTAVFGLVTITHAYTQLRSESRGTTVEAPENDRAKIY